MAEIYKNPEHEQQADALHAAEVLQQQNKERQKAAEQEPSAGLELDANFTTAYSDSGPAKTPEAVAVASSEITPEQLKHKKSFGEWIGSFLTNDAEILRTKGDKDSTTAYEVAEGITNPEIRKQMDSDAHDDLELK